MKRGYYIAFACLKCRKSFKRHVDVAAGVPDQKPCPECGGPSFNVGRHFKAPPRSNHAQWDKVRYLLSHGFRFQKIRIGPRHHDTVPYPKTLAEAKEFVKKYKRFAMDPVQLDEPIT